eukprot:5270-Eustigmatos_ZCMA.PRE.1
METYEDSMSSYPEQDHCEACAWNADAQSGRGLTVLRVDVAEEYLDGGGEHLGGVLVQIRDGD